MIESFLETRKSVRISRCFEGLTLEGKHVLSKPRMALRIVQTRVDSSKQNAAASVTLFKRDYERAGAKGHLLLHLANLAVLQALFLVLQMLNNFFSKYPLCLTHLLTPEDRRRGGISAGRTMSMDSRGVV